MANRVKEDIEATLKLKVQVEPDEEEAGLITVTVQG